MEMGGEFVLTDSMDEEAFISTLSASLHFTTTLGL